MECRNDASDAIITVQLYIRSIIGVPSRLSLDERNMHLFAVVAGPDCTYGINEHVPFR